MRYLITGATGFIGGHLAEALTQRGEQVCTIARPSSDTKFLETLGVAVHRGDIRDRSLIQKLLLDVDGIIHCAAKLGDWGPVSDYRETNVEALRGMLDACKGQPLSRFILMSSLGVYAARHHHSTDESEPLPKKHADGYSQSKVEAEQLALQYYRDFEVPVVVLRPGFVYGPRDRTVMPNIIKGLREGTIRYPGGGRGALNTIYIGNLVQAVLLALQKDNAVGQVYNLTDGEFVSKRQFIEKVADALDLPKPWRTPPLWIAKVVTRFAEGFAKMRGAKKAPMFTTAKLKFLGYNLDFSISKAKLELGYNPRHTFDDGMYHTMKWYKDHYGAAEPVPQK
jgi:nucleoside-diphosphate-sugar epimerase